MFPPPHPKSCKHHIGFTLPELLISLAILGVIATFTIPKILTAQQDEQKNANAHEVAAMISAAHKLYTLNNTYTSSTTPGALTPYMNYVSVDASSSVDDIPLFDAAFTCGSNVVCLKLHNGNTLFYQAAENFAGTATTNAIHFWLDPDGIRTGGVADGSGKSVVFVIYYNGQITSRALVKPGTITSTYSMNPGAGRDPSWFSW